MENKYQKLVRLLEDNNLNIKKNECYDPQSGWSGCCYYVYDGDTFIIDMSRNGYCFNDSSVDDTIIAIETYLENKTMDTFDKFKSWVYKHSK